MDINAEILLVLEKKDIRELAKRFRTALVQVHQLKMTIVSDLLAQLLSGRSYSALMHDSKSTPFRKSY